MSVLLDELRDDPAALGYAALIAARDDEGVAAMYNAATVPVLGKIFRDDLVTWATDTNMHGVIVDMAANPTHALRSSALSILSVINGGAADGIDLGRTGNANTLGLWVTSGLLSVADKDSFVAYATRDIPRSVAQLGRLVTARDIAITVRDDFGGSLLGT